MARRRWIFAIVVLAALLLAVGVCKRHRSAARATQHTDDATSDNGSSTDEARTRERAESPLASEDAAAPRPSIPPDHTVHDRALAVAIRQQILTDFWHPPPHNSGPGDPNLEPMPERDGGGVDPSYIRERIREDFVPMAETCYEQLLSRDSGAAGRIVMHFTILGDEHVGGVVDEASIDPVDGGLADPQFQTCMRESMNAMAFRPPPHSGMIRVAYPFNLRPDVDDASN